MTAMGIISWIVFGLIVGAVARFLLPGRQKMGMVMTMLLGVAGSFAGGALSTMIFDGGDVAAQPSGWIMSIVGAFLILFVYFRIAADK